MDHRQTVSDKAETSLVARALDAVDKAADKAAHGVARVVQTLGTDPALNAHFRLGLKELGNAFDLGHEGSVTVHATEYGMPGVGQTPGEVAREREGMSHGFRDAEQESTGLYGKAQAAYQKAQTSPTPERSPAEKDREMERA